MMQTTLGTSISLGGPLPRQERRLLRLQTWWRLWRERRALALLDGALLADIGVSQEAARVESRRPFWDVPAGRFGED